MYAVCIMLHPCLPVLKMSRMNDSREAPMIIKTVAICSNKWQPNDNNFSWGG